MKRSKKTPVQEKKSQDWGLLLLVVALFMFIITLFIDGDRGHKDQASRIPPKDTGIDSKLKDSALKEEMKRQSIEVDNQSALPIDDTIVDEYAPQTDTLPLRFDQDNHAQKVLRDLEDSQRRGQLATPDERISAKLARETWLREYEKNRNDEFVKQFLQNAREHGYEVQLNKNLDITGLGEHPVDEPIRIPQSLPQNPK